MNAIDAPRRNGTAKSMAPTEIVVRDRTVKPNSFDRLFKGVQSVAEVAFFIGCGVIRVAWEGLESLFKTAFEKKADGNRPAPFFLTAPAPLTRVKVPLLPIDNYTHMDDDQIINRLGELSHTQLRLVRDFERETLGRKRILEAVDRILEKKG